MDDKNTFRHMYFKHRASTVPQISGLLLPTDSDGVVRNKTFIECDLHPDCGSVKFVGCSFIDCDGAEYIKEALNCRFGEVRHG